MVEIQEFAHLDYQTEPIIGMKPSQVQNLWTISWGSKAALVQLSFTWVLFEISKLNHPKFTFYDKVKKQIGVLFSPLQPPLGLTGDPRAIEAHVGLTGAPWAHGTPLGCMGHHCGALGSLGPHRIGRTIFFEDFTTIRLKN